ncbi:MAG: DUF6250 domain-containing protein [Candidatus Scalinduaceae bacterium]
MNIMYNFILLICSIFSFILSETCAEEKPIFYEDFSKGMENWWVEGGEKVWVENGRLMVKANPQKGEKGYSVCTIWYKKKLHGNLQVEFDAHVVSSDIDVNNINFFFLYSDPSNKPLYDTRKNRQTAKYKLYHQLNGYIFTFVNDRDGKFGRYPDGSTKARIRIRRCPGFKLLTESYGYHCCQGKTYHIIITRHDKTLSISVDGKMYLEAEDKAPLSEGLLGLRTYRTNLWCDNIKVKRVGQMKIKE